MDSVDKRKRITQVEIDYAREIVKDVDPYICSIKARALSRKMQKIELYFVTQRPEDIITKPSQKQVLANGPSWLGRLWERAKALI